MQANAIGMPQAADLLLTHGWHHCCLSWAAAGTQGRYSMQTFGREQCGAAFLGTLMELAAMDIRYGPCLAHGDVTVTTQHTLQEVCSSATCSCAARVLNGHSGSVGGQHALQQGCQVPQVTPSCTGSAACAQAILQLPLCSKHCAHNSTSHGYHPFFCMSAV
jgi:hypothetical protein